MLFNYTAVRASCGLVHCNRSVLSVCRCVAGSVISITRNCVHRSSPNWVCMVKVVTISSWLNFDRPAPGRGCAAGRNFWFRLTTASAVFASPPIAFYPRDVVSAVYAMGTWLGAGWPGGWLAGCLSVTRRYCIKTTKPILKYFRPSGSPIILVSSDTCTDTQFQGEPRQRGR